MLSNSQQLIIAAMSRGTGERPRPVQTYQLDLPSS
jgi:hypothetical protein